MELRRLFRSIRVFLGLSLVALALLAAGGSLAQGADPAICESRYQRVMNGIKSIPGQVRAIPGRVRVLPAKAKEAWKKYREELREQGWKRLIVKDRENPEKFDHSIWWDPFTAPLYIPGQLLKTKKKLTIPADIAIAVPVGIWATGKAEQGIEKIWERKIEDVSDGKVPGQAYLRSLESDGVLDTNAVASALKKQVSDLNRWFSAREKRTPLPRSEEFKRLKLMTPEEAERLDQLAFQIYNEVVPRKGQSFAGFEDRLLDRWAQALAADPVFGKKSVALRGRLGTYFLPLVRFDELSDTELVSDLVGAIPSAGLNESTMQKIKSSAKILLAETAVSPEKIEKRSTEWRQLFPDDESMPPFLGRGDLREYLFETRFDSSATGDPSKSVSVKNEFDRWKLLWSDPRFLPIRAAYEQGEMSEREVLENAEESVEAYNELYGLQRESPIPDAGRVCRLLQGGNRLFRPVGRRIDKLVEERQGLTPSRIESCRITLGGLYWEYYQRQLRVGNEEEFRSLLSQREQFSDQVIENCLKAQKVFFCPKP